MHTRERRWRLLRLGARWDRCVAPVYEASGRGGHVPLLKTLLTNVCRHECAYCGLRAGRGRAPLSWKPEKLVEVTLHLWRTGRIAGLFLSSSIPGDPDRVVERQLDVLKGLRSRGFTGYIHLKLMPGVSRHLISEAVELADRVGVNLEAPDPNIFSEICPDKGGFGEAVLKRLSWAVDEVRRARLRAPDAEFGCGRAGVDTQMVVGAAEDDDLQYLEVVEMLYRRLGLRRVYFSGFEPQPYTPLERRLPCPKSRVRRLYQASFLIRDYGIGVDELAQILEGGLLPNVDPKVALARQTPDLFPIDLNTATYREILRIPGIGPVNAKKIVEARKRSKIRRISDLERILGASLARGVLPYVHLEYKPLTSYAP